jgi:hypothetical protein
MWKEAGLADDASDAGRGRWFAAALEAYDQHPRNGFSTGINQPGLAVRSGESTTLCRLRRAREHKPWIYFYYCSS